MTVFIDGFRRIILRELSFTYRHPTLIVPPYP
jgi:hypothetical protein